MLTTPPLLDPGRTVCFDDSLDGIHASASTGTSDDATRSTGHLHTLCTINLSMYPPTTQPHPTPQVASPTAPDLSSAHPPSSTDPTPSSLPQDTNTNPPTHQTPTTPAISVTVPKPHPPTRPIPTRPLVSRLRTQSALSRVAPPAPHCKLTTQLL